MMLSQCRWARAILTATGRQQCSLALGVRKNVFTYSFFKRKKNEERLDALDNRKFKLFQDTRNYSKDVASSINLQNLQINDKDNLTEEEKTKPVSVLDEALFTSENQDDTWEKEMIWIKNQETKDVLSAPKDVSEIDIISPQVRPTFNLAAYVNRSETLQEMVKLGVDLSKWEKRKGISTFILKLELERDMKQHLIFLHDMGVKTEHLGRWLTVNPLIFRETIENLHSRINYLKSMKFTDDDITRIVSRNPNWLLFSSIRIDNRLGFFQRSFNLNGNEIRTLATREPRLITCNLHHIKRTSIAVNEEMGFSQDEMKNLILSKPKLWMKNGPSLLRRFDYAHNEMGLSHSQLVKFPNILLSREFRIKQRHQYLKILGRDQYNPEKPNYVSPNSLIGCNDADFCSDIAKSTIQDFNNFLKTL